MNKPKGSVEIDGTNIVDMSYETAIAKLDENIAQLEAGQATLEETLKIYERAMKLAQHCDTLLAKTEQQVTKLVTEEQGLIEVPFENEIVNRGETRK